MKVLITDDSEFMRKIIRSSLSGVPGSHEFMEAENGDVAVELCRTFKPDIVFLDIIMPVKNGIMAMEEIKAMSPTTKVVIVTSVGQEEMVSKAKELNADEFIPKPFQPAQIKEVFQKFLGQQ
jgi:two-component system chemotaxis response regulator CheY